MFSKLLYLYDKLEGVSHSILFKILDRVFNKYKVLSTLFQNRLSYKIVFKKRGLMLSLKS
jgi:hypothetical protein